MNETEAPLVSSVALFVFTGENNVFLKPTQGGHTPLMTLSKLGDGSLEGAVERLLDKYGLTQGVSELSYVTDTELPLAEMPCMVSVYACWIDKLNTDVLTEYAVDGLPPQTLLADKVQEAYTAIATDAILRSELV